MTNETISTAVIPAAGMGRRLHPHTKHQPKCMLQVASKPILQHLIESLEASGFTRLIIITGHCADVLENFVTNLSTSLQIELVHNDIYDSTNNIYSLMLAFPLLKEGFMLIESDLIIDPQSVKSFTVPDRIALDRFDPDIHSGTTAVVDSGYLSKLYVYSSAPKDLNIFKTVNIYSFSKKTTNLLKDYIEDYVADGEDNIFYEKALSDLVDKQLIKLEMVDFRSLEWYEIDTEEDLETTNQTLVKEVLVSGNNADVME